MFLFILFLIYFIFFIFCAQVHKLFWTLKVFFFPFYSFYLKNDLFSLFYSGPFDFVKFDVVVGLKESVLGEYHREKCGKLTLFQSDIKAGN